MDATTVGDGYPANHRHSVEDGGQAFTLRVRGRDVVADNRGVVPHSCIINHEEYCHAFKSIENRCEHCTREGDTAVSGLENTCGVIDEIEWY